jgi:hypothetical protein
MLNQAGMRRSITLILSIVTSSIVLTRNEPARAGFIADENAKPGTDWLPTNDGTSFGAGVVDVYPARWSITRGETVRLKVRSTTGYSLHVYRLGWYGGAGAREVATRTGLSTDPQPYPSADEDTGSTAAGWHDSVTVATDATWTPGVYVARIDQDGGRQAATFFVVRDTGFAPRPRILVVVGTNTHQAYNAWPGASRGGKSLYAFNSSPGHPKEGESDQAVKVSYDRPFLVGMGLADLANFEVPYVRWLERYGWDVAYCTDQDLHSDPSVVAGRNVFSVAGHWEYVSRAMVESTRTARDAGTNLLFLTGDTISYQVRFEDGLQTMVGYKESWPNDPENIAGRAAQDAGDLAAAKSHYRMVTRGWRNVGNPLTAGEPGMSLTGVHSGGAFGPNGPWGDLVIEAPDHWLFEGTGFSKGDRITRVMGYEFDSAEVGDPSWDPFRPPGQVILGTIVRPSTGEARGNAAYYKAGSGAEIVALGAVQFSWALDRFSSTFGDSSDPRAGRMVHNALVRWTSAPPPVEIDAGPPVPDAAAIDDAAIDDATIADATTPDGSLDDTSFGGGTPPAGVTDASLVDDDGTAVVTQPATPTTEDHGSCGCEVRGASRSSVVVLGLALAALSRRRKRR